MYRGATHRVERELVARVDVLALGVLDEDADFATRERLQGPVELLLLCEQKVAPDIHAHKRSRQRRSQHGQQA